MPQIQTQNKTRTDERTPTPSNHLLLPLGITASHSSTHSQSTCTKLKDEVSILSSCSAHSIRSVQCVRKTAHDDAVWRLLNFNPYFHSTNTYRETHRRKPAAKQHHQLTRTHTYTHRRGLQNFYGYPFGLPILVCNGGSGGGGKFQTHSLNFLIHIQAKNKILSLTFVLSSSVRHP